MQKLGTESAKRIDLLVLVALVAAAFVCNLILVKNAKADIGFSLFIIPGALYLGRRAPKKPWRKILLSTLVFGGLFGLFFEFTQESTQSYEIVSRIFPKIAGVVPFDNVLAHMLMAFLTFIFYEHFINRRPNNNISPRIKYVASIASVLIIAEIFIHYFHPGLFQVRYPYLYFGTLAIMPPFILAYRHPAYARDLTLIVPFFFYLYMMIEIVAVRYDWWIYSGDNYIGNVQLGSMVFPFEELFYWMLFYAAALVSYYKIFADS